MNHKAKEIILATASDSIEWKSKYAIASDITANRTVAKFENINCFSASKTLKKLPHTNSWMPLKATEKPRIAITPTLEEYFGKYALIIATIGK